MLGATVDETQKVIEHWDQFDEDWTPEAQARFLTANDKEIRRLLDDVRDEYPYEPEHQPYVMDEAPDAVVMGVDTPDPMPQNATIAVLEAWVGGDADRARRALTVERASERPRSTLIGRLEAVVDAS